MEKIWLKNYPKEVPPIINVEKYQSIPEVFDEAIRKYGNATAFTNLGFDLSFAELDKKSADFASFLQNELKLKKGDRIAIQMPNCLQFPIALFGAIRAGLVVVNTNPLYTAREMKYQFNDSGTKAVVILANFAHLLEQVLKDTPVESVIVTELGDMLPAPKKWIVNAVVKHVKKMVPPFHLPHAYKFNQALKIGSTAPFKPQNLTLKDLAFLQYTGGTTGVSKGAMLTHGNICANMLQIAAWIGPVVKEGQEMIITALPMYHIFSLTVNCLFFMNYGAHNILITNPKDIPAFIKDMKKYKFTCMSGVNTLFNALMNHADFGTIDFKQVKVTVAGGMALQTAVANRWKEKTKSLIVEGYGLTETSPVAAVNPLDGTDRVGTIGLPIPNTEMKIIDDNGKELNVGDVGEICIRGPQVMQGYWQKPEETANVMTADGYFKTGDIATIQEGGFFKIVDRKKDMILVSGFNVYPNEVEDVVATLPGIAEVAAVGIPDERSGEVVKLFVVKKDPALTDQQIIAHCKAQLTGYKVPKSVEFRTELPKTNVGKILRRALRDSTP
ncbi:MAG: AMP-binding protein [Pseudobdellovibrionaceae bacterium]